MNLLLTVFFLLTLSLSPSFAREESAAPNQIPGIGLVFSPRSEEQSIAAVLENSSAWQQGIRPGDQVIAVNGRTVRGMTLQDLIKMLKGKQGTWLELTVQRPEATDGLSAEVQRSRLKQGIYQLQGSADTIAVALKTVLEQTGAVIEPSASTPHRFSIKTRRIADDAYGVIDAVKKFSYSRGDERDLVSVDLSLIASVEPGETGTEDVRVRMVPVFTALKRPSGESIDCPTNGSYELFLLSELLSQLADGSPAPTDVPPSDLIR